MSTTTSSLGLVKPDVNDQVATTISDLASNMDKIDKASSWVGMVIFSTVVIDPVSIYGGTWTSLVGRFLVGAGDDYPAGQTGGEATHTLTVAEMPAHRHTMQGVNSGTTTEALMGNYPIDIHQDTKPNWNVSDTFMDTTGGGSAHNNLPPFQSVYMWVRTA